MITTTVTIAVDGKPLVMLTEAEARVVLRELSRIFDPPRLVPYQPAHLLEDVRPWVKPQWLEVPHTGTPMPYTQPIVTCTAEQTAAHDETGAWAETQPVTPSL